MSGNDLGRCFVTGCAGFIGSHLVERLLSDGWSVTGYDNLSSGRRGWLERSLRQERFRFIEADLRDLQRLEEALQGHDTVFHLGANADIPGGTAHPRLDLENGVLATFNLLEAMRANSVRRLLFASSSTVYGESEVLPMSERAGPLLPISLYGASKLGCEGLISAYCHLFGLRAWIFRFGNVLGARMSHGVIYDFIQKLKRDPTKLEILGDGKQEKNYFLVEDCIDGMQWTARHANDKPCEVFNLGTESTIKVDDIARIVVEEMGLGPVRFHYTGGPRGWPGDAPTVVYDTTKIKRLGWQAGHTSEEAIRIATRRLLANAT